MEGGTRDLNVLFQKISTAHTTKVTITQRDSVILRSLIVQELARRKALSKKRDECFILDADLGLMTAFNYDAEERLGLSAEDIELGNEEIENES